MFLLLKISGGVRTPGLPQLRPWIAGSYLDLHIGGGCTTQNIQVKFLVIFKSGESSIFVIFFFVFLSNAGFTKNRLLCSSFLTPVRVLRVTLVFYLIFH
jgi:hypothetical protein